MPNKKTERRKKVEYPPTLQKVFQKIRSNIGKTFAISLLIMTFINGLPHKTSEEYVLEIPTPRVEVREKRRVPVQKNSVPTEETEIRTSPQGRITYESAKRKVINSPFIIRIKNSTYYVVPEELKNIALDPSMFVVYYESDDSAKDTNPSIEDTTTKSNAKIKIDIKMQDASFSIWLEGKKIPLQVYEILADGEKIGEIGIGYSNTEGRPSEEETNLFVRILRRKIENDLYFGFPKIVKIRAGNQKILVPKKEIIGKIQTLEQKPLYPSLFMQWWMNNKDSLKTAWKTLLLLGIGLGAVAVSTFQQITQNQRKKILSLASRIGLPVMAYLLLPTTLPIVNIINFNLIGALGLLIIENMDKLRRIRDKLKEWLMGVKKSNIKIVK